MTEYADTSFLLSYYVPDANHGAAAAHVRGWKRPPQLPLTPFGSFEFNNSLRRLIRAGHLLSGDLAVIARAVRADAISGVITDSPLQAWRWIDLANQTSRQVTPQTGTRALDVLHVAMARVYGAKVFLSFDKNQRQAAQAAGLSVAP